MWLLGTGHAVDDIYQGAVPALIPFLVAARHWDYVAASGITLAATVLSSVLQPAFGMLTDRRQLPWLVPAGMSLAGAGIGLSGLGHSYLLTWLAVALSGLGVAAYHPESARLARAASRGSQAGMSWFAMGGNVGFALGPVVVGIVPGPAVFAAVAAAAIVLYIPFSLHVTLGQDYLPARVGTASGVTLGLAVSVGGLAVPVLGVIADHTSLRTALALLTLMPLVCALAGLGMREPRTPSPASGFEEGAGVQALG